MAARSALATAAAAAVAAVARRSGAREFGSAAAAAVLQQRVGDSGSGATDASTAAISSPLQQSADPASLEATPPLSANLLCASGLLCDPCGCGLRGGGGLDAVGSSVAARAAAAAAPAPAQPSGWCFGRAPALSSSSSVFDDEDDDLDIDSLLGRGPRSRGTSTSSTRSSSISTSTDSTTTSSSSSGGGGASSSSSSSSASSAGKAASAAAASADADPLAAALRSGAASARHLTPSEVVRLLDAHIVGQRDAKRAVAVALRNRWRRHRLDAAAAREVAPRNILMVGPTGCGKTEVARRLARLVDAPFVKVEATKFTELGYVGRDADDIVKDLAEAAMALTKSRLKAALAARAEARAEERILGALVGELADKGVFETFRQLYREGALDDRLVDVPAAAAADGNGGRGGPEALLQQTLEQMGILVAPPPGSGGMPGRARRGSSGDGSGRQRMRVADARRLLVDREAGRWLAGDAVEREAARAASEDGIVFIDEIDKVAVRGGGGGGGIGGGTSGGGVSSEGVQRDLLPILEGCAVGTKYGEVTTDHVLFICAGAFHAAKPSDLLAELQGRLPVRVELKGLGADELHRVLTEPKSNMIAQQAALLAAEGVELAFEDDAVRAVADAAEEANRMLDNIGARRLHTVLERVLADISYTAPDRVAAARAERRRQREQQQSQQQQQAGGSDSASTEAGAGKPSAAKGSGAADAGDEAEPLVRHVVTAADVRAAVGPLLKKVDLSRYML